MNGSPSPRERWENAYAALRAREGRAGEETQLAIPYLDSGPLAAQWRIRARTYDRFVRAVIAPLERRLGRPLCILDLGAGAGWLAARLAARGHRALAVDLRLDGVDGLAAGHPFGRGAPGRFARLAADFQALPFERAAFDVAVFNASLHYATNCTKALAGTKRAVAPGGHLVILDSPFYGSADSGEAMKTEKQQRTREALPDLADGLLALPFVEYFTAGRLAEIAAPLGLSFSRLRVWYPLRYELRGLVARLSGLREPSRFDLWTARVT
ncbi:MAG: class I SAM-dependent methyltransferase [Thermoanaerobaculia bacterium]